MKVLTMRVNTNCLYPYAIHINLGIYTVVPLMSWLDIMYIGRRRRALLIQRTMKIYSMMICLQWIEKQKDTSSKSLQLYGWTG